MALEIPLAKGNLGQKSISFIGPSFWNKLRNLYFSWAFSRILVWKILQIILKASVMEF